MQGDHVVPDRSPGWVASLEPRLLTVGLLTTASQRSVKYRTINLIYATSVSYIPHDQRNYLDAVEAESQ
jgi:hypothetical protein